MDIQQSLNVDARSAIIMRGNMWSFNFLAFALLFDIMYRAMVWHEAAWDLYALLIASGIFSLVYAIRHKVLPLNRKSIVAMALLAFMAAAVAAIVAYVYTVTTVNGADTVMQMIDHFTNRA
jgi:hypothetical protein